MNLEKISIEIMNKLEVMGYQYVVSSNISGIISEGDDVHNLLTPFTRKEDGEMFISGNQDMFVMDISAAKEEVLQAGTDRTGISFFIETKHLKNL